MSVSYLFGSARPRHFLGQLIIGDLNLWLTLKSATAARCRVIFLEDDKDFRESFSDFLSLHSIDVTSVASVAALRTTLERESFEIALLDANLSDGSGLDVASYLRAETKMGIIMLTARSGREDRLAGYEKGADLYFTKPVDGEELVLAISNLADRMKVTKQPPPTLVAKPMTSSARWKLHLPSQRLVSPGGAIIKLSGREAKLVACLAEAAGEVVSRRMLSDAIGYFELDADKRGLDAVLRRLRQKARDASTELPVHVVHAVGFRFAGDVEISSGVKAP